MWEDYTVEYMCFRVSRDQITQIYPLNVNLQSEIAAYVCMSIA